MSERTTVRLPADLLDRARRQAAAEGRNLSSLIEEGLRRVVDESRRDALQTRTLPRIGAATGGPMPGVDLTNVSALQEIDDLDCVERTGRLGTRP